MTLCIKVPCSIVKILALSWFYMYIQNFRARTWRVLGGLYPYTLIPIYIGYDCWTQATLREASSLEKHVFLKKLRGALESLKERVAGRNKNDVEEAFHGRLEGMLLEAKGSWADAEKANSSILVDNTLDDVIHKRRVVVTKAQRNIFLSEGSKKL